MDYETECPKITAEVRKFLEKNKKFENKQELVVYGVAQLVHELVNELEGSDAFKGAIVSDILISFRELNKESLAIYNAERAAILEQKDSTLH